MSRETAGYSEGRGLGDRAGATVNRGSLASYGLILLTWTVAGAAAFVLRPLIAPSYDIPIIAAAAVTAGLAGFRPALITAAVGLLAAGSLSVTVGSAPLAFTAGHLGGSIAVAGVVTFIIEKVRRDKAAAAAAAREYSFRLGQAEQLIGQAVVDSDAHHRLMQERNSWMAREQSARIAAHALRRRLALATAAGRAVATARDIDGVLESVASKIVPPFADWCAFDLVGRDGVPHGVVARARTLPPARAGGSENGPAIELLPRSEGVPALRTRGSRLYAQLSAVVAQGADADQISALRGQGLSSAVVAPLSAHGRVLGAVGVGRADPLQPLDADDLRLVEELAAQVALAVSGLEHERAANEAQARYRGVLAGALDAMLLIDADGRYIDANAAAADLLERPREELLSLRIGELPIAGPAWTEADRERFAREGSWRGEMELPRRHSSPIPVDVRVTAVVLPTRTLYLAVLRDVSSRRSLKRLRDGFTVLMRRELDGPRARLEALANRLRQEGGRRYARPRAVLPFRARGSQKQTRVRSTSARTG